MSRSVRWLVVLGWALPAAVAALVLARWPPPPTNASVWRSGAAVLLLVAPVLPLSVIVCTLAVVAGRRRRQEAPHRFGMGDRAFFTAAVAGDILAVVGVLAVIGVYVA